MTVMVACETVELAAETCDQHTKAVRGQAWCIALTVRKVNLGYAQGCYTWILLNWPLFCTILKRLIFLSVCVFLYHDSLHTTEVQSVLYNTM